jgi:hypothetical protein
VIQLKDSTQRRRSRPWRYLSVRCAALRLASARLTTCVTQGPGESASRAPKTRANSATLSSMPALLTPVTRSTTSLGRCTKLSCSSGRCCEAGGAAAVVAAGGGGAWGARAGLRLEVGCSGLRAGAAAGALLRASCCLVALQAKAGPDMRRLLPLLGDGGGARALPLSLAPGSEPRLAERSVRLTDNVSGRWM